MSASATGHNCEFQQACGLAAADLKAFTVHALPHLADDLGREDFCRDALKPRDNQNYRFRAPLIAAWVVAFGSCGRR